MKTKIALLTAFLFFGHSFAHQADRHDSSTKSDLQDSLSEYHYLRFGFALTYNNKYALKVESERYDEIELRLLLTDTPLVNLTLKWYFAYAVQYPAVTDTFRTFAIEETMQHFYADGPDGSSYPRVDSVKEFKTRNGLSGLAIYETQIDQTWSDSSDTSLIKERGQVGTFYWLNISNRNKTIFLQLVHDDYDRPATPEENPLLQEILSSVRLDIRKPELSIQPLLKRYESVDTIRFNILNSFESESCYLTGCDNHLAYWLQILDEGVWQDYTGLNPCSYGSVELHPWQMRFEELVLTNVKPLPSGKYRIKIEFEVSGDANRHYAYSNMFDITSKLIGSKPELSVYTTARWYHTMDTIRININNLLPDEVTLTGCSGRLGFWFQNLVDGTWQDQTSFNVRCPGHPMYFPPYAALPSRQGMSEQLALRAESQQMGKYRIKMQSRNIIGRNEFTVPGKYRIKIEFRLPGDVVRHYVYSNIFEITN